MPRFSLRDRFFTPPVARAISSPSGILLAGAGASVAILAGLPFLAVAGVGVAAWGARVALAVPKNPSTGPRIDPSSLRQPWQRFVKDAVDARRRFDIAIHNAKPGPLQARLTELAARIDDGVDECWRIARQAQQLANARTQLGVEDAARDLAQLTAANPTPPPDSPVQHTIEALQAQLATAQRMDKTIEQAGDQLRLLDARLDEAVARAYELTLQTDDVADASSLSNDIDGLVTDREALRQGMEEAAGRPATGPATGTA